MHGVRGADVGADSSLDVRQYRPKVVPDDGDEFISEFCVRRGLRNAVLRVCWEMSEIPSSEFRVQKYEV